MKKKNLKMSMMEKTKKILSYVVLTVLLAACTDDFLDIDVQDTIIEEDFYKTDQQMLSATAPLYGPSFFTCNDKFMYSLDMLSGNSLGFEADAAYKLFSIPSDNGPLLEGWEGYYKGIADANQILKIINRGLNPEITADVARQVEGEARFTRAFSYYYLVRLWGSVPIIDELSQDVSDLYPLHTVSSIYNFIEVELMKAAELLPVEPSDSRRIGKTAPWAFLADMHLTRRNYAKAKEYAELVINSGLHSLNANYQDQFINPTLLDNPESIYAWYWKAINGVWGIQNTNQAYLSFSTEVVGNEGAFGSVAPSPDLYFAFENKEAVDGVEDERRSWILMEPGRVYPELLSNTRTGLQYFGEGASKMRYRKYVVGSNNEYPGSVFFMRTEMPTQLMRYADILLIHAEAILGDSNSTSDAIALNSFNEVRRRAGLPAKASFTKLDMLNERRIEFAIEAGKFWLDLLRLNQEGDMAKTILRSQDRGTVDSYNPFVTSTVRIEESLLTGDFLLPIPAAEEPFIDISNPPVEYVID